MGKVRASRNRVPSAGNSTLEERQFVIPAAKVLPSYRQKGSSVIPAKAGTQLRVSAFAGMTERSELPPLVSNRHHPWIDDGKTGHLKRYRIPGRHTEAARRCDSRYLSVSDRDCMASTAHTNDDMRVGFRSLDIKRNDASGEE